MNFYDQLKVKNFQYKCIAEIRWSFEI